MSKVFVALRLSSKTKTVESMESHLGIRGDATWRKGEQRGRSRLVEQESGIEFRAGTPPDSSIEEQADDLLARMDMVADKVQNCGFDGVQLTCVVYASSVPVIHISREAVERLGRLGASLDIDVHMTED